MFLFQKEAVCQSQAIQEAERFVYIHKLIFSYLVNKVGHSSPCEQAGKLDAKKMKLRRFRLEELQKATENFSQEFLIGRGSFANVYRGTFPVEGTLAIKKPHSEAYTSIEDFRNGKFIDLLKYL